MTTHRFFVAAAEMAGEAVPLPSVIAHQVTRVLRLADGDELVLLDGQGNQARCRLEGAASQLRVLERGRAPGEPRHRLTIWQALLKGDGLERVVQQGTELGVARFRLVVSARCVTREVSARKMERLRAIARESAEQSERAVVPPIHEPLALDAALHPAAVMLYERAGEGVPRLARLELPAELIVGPEGGFAPGEVDAAQAAGVTLASLGPRILRAGSVALAAAAVVLSHSGDFA